MTNLFQDERIVNCEPTWLNSTRDGPCDECGAVPYRILTIKASTGIIRRLSLCGRHFLEMFQSLSELEKGEVKGW
ncbi:MAG TPA: hypothetical protein VKZ53_04740 [Candidatus Angelobacter sp.]|nr:hypothetical protein [Candidatus Angelobacter sp.]